MTYEDPPSPRAVIRAMLGGTTLVAAVVLVALLIGSGHVEWKLVTLTLVLWSAYSFFDSLLGGVVEPLGRFLEGQFLGGDVPAGPSLTIDQEAAALEHLLTSGAPSTHRAILAGIRLAEIYRTHQHDPAKADALITRLAAQYPDAPELRYVRPPAAG
ncbi:MAG TPA: hypothetical protein VEU55_08715 [Gemmatimonadales bacterium]|nr:hypothetical protein [Gemmatimonadales bacterium]